jgi:transposase
MKSYSTDLRQKILHAHARRLGSQRALADLFGVSVSFVEKLLSRHQRTGAVAPKPHAGGQKRRLGAAAEASIREAVRATPDITLEDLCALVADAHGLRVSVPTMCRALHASERDTPHVQQARADYHAVMQPLAVERDKFIDESSINLTMTRLFGRAPRGARVVDTVPQNYGPNVTMIGALSLQGLDAVMTVDGATDGAVFQAYVEQVLGPTLVAGDVVLMDNLGAHKVAWIRETIESHGAQVVYLPPYSPDLSPIEPCWSKVKTALRKAKARTREALDHALAHVLSTVTAIDARNWFTHCGYTIQ